MINNACATQAILSILLNAPDISLGPELSNFKTFTKDFPPNLKGLAISNSDLVRTAHNSFQRFAHALPCARFFPRPGAAHSDEAIAQPCPYVPTPSGVCHSPPPARARPLLRAPLLPRRAEPFVMESRSADKDDDLYHFISYVPIGGKLYELDGLKSGPICLGECPPDDWLAAARPEIQKRIEQYSAKEIRFNLMAIIKNRAEIFTEEQSRYERERDRTIGLVQSRGATLPSNDELEHMLDRARTTGLDTQIAPVEPGMEASVTLDELYLLLASLNEQLAAVRHKLRLEEEKYAQWKTENVRRKHNYIPFILNFIKLLASKGELMPLVNKAKQKQPR